MTPAGNLVEPADADDRLMRLEHAIWGVQGDNGLTRDVRAIKRAFYAYVEDERKRRENEAERREEEAERQRGRDRATVLAAVSSCIGLVGVIVTLVIVLVQTGGTP